MWIEPARARRRLVLSAVARPGRAAHCPPQPHERNTCAARANTSRIDRTDLATARGFTHTVTGHTHTQGDTTSRSSAVHARLGAGEDGGVCSALSRLGSRAPRSPLEPRPDAATRTRRGARRARRASCSRGVYSRVRRTGSARVRVARSSSGESARAQVRRCAARPYSSASALGRSRARRPRVRPAPRREGPGTRGRAVACGPAAPHVRYRISRISYPITYIIRVCPHHCQSQHHCV